MQLQYINGRGFITNPIKQKHICRKTYRKQIYISPTDSSPLTKLYGGYIERELL